MTIAGHKVHVVWFRDWWYSSPPVFHRWVGPDTLGCGLSTGPGSAMPPRLAVKIGRPCKRCFSGGEPS